MAKVNVGIPQGTRDFGPDVVRKRNYIFDTIRNVFELYGFQPLETPAMENLETLMGKYGEEGDKLIFRILDSGNPFEEEFFYGLFQGLRDYINNYNEQVRDSLRRKGINEPAPFDKSLLDTSPAIIASMLTDLFDIKYLKDLYLPKLKTEISNKALKYDLTIPFARYVAMNHHQLTFPFKRYQIQPVWRADRPQKGRYREFYQCDADVVGSKSLLNELELANIYHDIFIQLGIKNYELRINNRKLLTALAELCGGAEKMLSITIAIDKLDKIGLEKVKEELSKTNLNSDQITVIEKYLNISGSNAEKLNQIKSLLGDNETAQQGIEEISMIVNSGVIPTDSRLIIDFTLARGLNYYTGIIFEAKAPEQVKIGSIGGGGRYDDLTGLFGVPDIPGVGISFGVDRIYDVMEELKLFPDELNISTQLLFFYLGEEESKTAFSLMQQLRAKGIRCELYPEGAKFDKQFKYAEKKSIPYIVIIGTKEIEEKNCTMKDLRTGEQKTISQIELINDPIKFLRGSL